MFTVLTKWTCAKLSQAKESNVSKIKQNREAAIRGCTNAPAFGRFQKDPQAQFKVSMKRQGNGKQGGLPANARHAVFGRQSQASDANVSNLIAAQFTSYANEDGSYPDTSGQQTKGRLPKSRNTQAAILRAEQVKQQLNPQPKAQFKMKKFANVNSRVGGGN